MGHIHIASQPGARGTCHVGQEGRRTAAGICLDPMHMTLVAALWGFKGVWPPREDLDPPAHTQLGYCHQGGGIKQLLHPRRLSGDFCFVQRRMREAKANYSELDTSYWAIHQRDGAAAAGGRNYGTHVETPPSAPRKL